MNNQYRHSLFTLLYAVVLIDNRVVRVEVDQFFKVLEDFMKDVERVNTLEAKSTISNWFVMNYKKILSEMRSANRETFLLNHVRELKSYEHRGKVFEIMQHIANADDELHASEKQLLDRVSEAWELDG